jgi:hypothetical protein
VVVDKRKVVKGLVVGGAVVAGAVVLFYSVVIVLFLVFMNGVEFG